MASWVGVARDLNCQFQQPSRQARGLANDVEVVDLSPEAERKEQQEEALNERHRQKRLEIDRTRQEFQKEIACCLGIFNPHMAARNLPEAIVLRLRKKEMLSIAAISAKYSVLHS